VIARRIDVQRRDHDAVTITRAIAIPVAIATSAPSTIQRRLDPGSAIDRAAVATFGGGGTPSLVG
jgi:hypothetical protein